MLYSKKIVENIASDRNLNFFLGQCKEAALIECIDCQIINNKIYLN